MQWAVAITTAPRDGAEYLIRSLASVARAGWDQVTLHAEIGSPVPAGSRVVWNTDGQVGPWPAFRRAVTGLRQSCPEADACLVFQDDVEVAVGLRAWLEGELWPLGSERGVLSLYTAEGIWRGREPGWFRLEQPPYKCWGALAIALHRDAADAMLRSSVGKGSRNSTDAWLGRWCRDERRPWIQHAPGFVDHTGAVSSTRRRGWPDTPARRAGGTAEVPGPGEALGLRLAGKSPKWDITQTGR